MASLHDLNERRACKSARPHTDKLAQTKLTEKAQRDAHKQLLREKKASKEQERLAEAAVMRKIRALNGNSKRAKVDERKAARKEAHAATGSMCEHGIWRCAICFPRTSSRKVSRDSAVA